MLPLSPAVAVLEFEAAATGTWVVAPGLGKTVFQVRILPRQVAHDVGRRSPGLEFGGHKAHRPIDVGEEGLVPCTKIVDASGEAVLGAATVADKVDLALAAGAGQRVALV